MKTKFAILTSIITVLLFTISCVPQPEVCDTNGIGLISKETSYLLANNYKESIARSEYNNPNNPDSRSVWFSYDEMKKYMCVLENEYKKTHDEDPDLSKLGIRVYFGRYPDLKIESLSKFGSDSNIISNDLRSLIPEGIDDDTNYSNKHCVFFVPTYEAKSKNGDKINQDFMTERLVTNPKATSGILLINKNHGGLAPPENMEGAEYLYPVVEQSTAP